MSWIKRLRIYSILLSLIILLSLSNIEYVSPQVTRLSTKVSQNVIIAERNNTVMIEVGNEYKDLYDLDIGLSIPPPLAILSSGNHWRLTNLKKGESYRIELSIYAPKSALGNTFAGTLTIAYKELGYISYSVETHNFNLIVYGWIDMVIYDLIVLPQPATLGSEITISANLLNKGNVAAMYTNATVIPRDCLILTRESSVYIGQVDPNSPAPFSLITNINPETQEGFYRITLLVSYQDDRHTVHELKIDTQIEIIKPSIGPSKPVSGGIQEWLVNNAWIIVLMGFFIMLSIIYVIRRRRKIPISIP
ncbi:MAG: hypothetical protein QXG01_08165 [Candidatus Bathyarchaeia archaeon]